MVQKRKFVIILGALILAGGLCVASLAGAASQQKDSRPGQQDFKTSDVNFPFAGGEQFKTGELFYKMAFAVLVVVALAIGVMYFLKRLLPKIAHLPAKQIRIVETVSLGQHRNIYLVEVSGRRLLIGGTNETITRLADLSEPVELSEE